MAVVAQPGAQLVRRPKSLDAPLPGLKHPWRVRCGLQRPVRHAERTRCDRQRISAREIPRRVCSLQDADQRDRARDSLILRRCMLRDRGCLGFHTDRSRRYRCRSGQSG